MHFLLLKRLFFLVLFLEKRGEERIREGGRGIGQTSVWSTNGATRQARSALTSHHRFADQNRRANSGMTHETSVKSMSLVAPFVRFCDGAYVLDESTAEWLAQVPAPFAVVACAGKFRTGKSFLLNKLSGSNIFGVGDTVQPCTRGIWLCKAFLRRDTTSHTHHPHDTNNHAAQTTDDHDDVEARPRDTSDEPNILLMDTEGIDALDAESEHDVRIFALAVLASSMLVYNSNSHLDEAAIQALSLMTSVADAVAGSTHEHSLCWVLRDFALDLVDASGRPMTAQQYLDSALDAATSSKTKCATREAICSVFDTRTLHTLPRPHLGTQSASNDGPSSRKSSASTSAAAKTGKAFDRALGSLRTYVCDNARPFNAHGVPLSGAVYVDFVRCVVSKVNECGTIPKLHDSWTLVSRMQHADVERSIRTLLLESASAQCVRSTEDDITKWATECVRLRLRECRFVPPHPDTKSLDDLTHRLVHDLVRHCVALGKVVDVDEVARSIVDAFFAHLVTKSNGSAHSSLTALPTAHQLLGFYTTLPPSPSSSSTTSENDDHCKCGRRGRQASVRARALEFFHHRVVTAVIPQFEARVSQLVADLDACHMDIEHMREREAYLNLELTQQLRSRDDVVLHCPVARFENAYTQTPSCDSHHILMSAEIECESAEWKNEASTRSSAIDLECERRRLDEEMHHKIRALETNLASADARAAASDERVNAVREACDAAMDALRSTTNERVRELVLQRDDALADARRCADHRAALEAECDKMRALVKEAQQRTVDVHKSTLDELRRRDDHVRDAADARRKEWGEVCARAEWAENEVRSLKRRVDELLVVAEDAKRLRASNVEAMLERARSDVAMEMTRLQLDDVRAQNETLVRANADLSNRVAVLEVSSKLEACKQSLL